MIIVRKAHFNCAHRLHSNKLSDADNKKIFGKCNNPNGHGHNYKLEVELSGEVDPITGMVINLTEVDQIIKENIINAFDHKNLNLDCKEFKDIVPTAENIAIVIWEKLEKTKLKSILHMVILHETEKNYVKYKPNRK